MKTSSLILRPSVPLAILTEGKAQIPSEPMAKLVYGGVTIEIPLTIIHCLKLDLSPEEYTRAVSIFRLGIDEISKEMCFDIEKLQCCPPLIWFRDNQAKCTLDHVWQSPEIKRRDKHYIEWDQELKDHESSKWKTNYREALK